MARLIAAMFCRACGEKVTVNVKNPLLAHFIKWERKGWYAERRRRALVQQSGQAVGRVRMRMRRQDMDRQEEEAQRIM